MYDEQMEKQENKTPKIRTKYKPIKIVTYPDSKLRRKSHSVRIDVNLEEVQQLIDLMFKTLKIYKGTALSAPQTGVGLRVIVVDMQDGIHEPISMINPVITMKEGSQEIVEKCLSLPYSSATILRAKTIKVDYLDKNAVEQHLETTGELASIIQHEIEHLDGILYLDHMSKLKQDLVRNRLLRRKGLR